jgi:hypothetical protein
VRPYDADHECHIHACGEGYGVEGAGIGLDFRRQRGIRVGMRKETNSTFETMSAGLLLLTGHEEP